MKLHSKFVWERFVTAIKVDRIPSNGNTIDFLYKITKSVLNVVATSLSSNECSGSLLDKFVELSE